ncbi:MAG: aminoglycoside phosphotransferase family protein [Phycisphaerales bacterium]|nr:MAG: aminoglycoside phosphotransferase family protein [Phycisphaerales bacterium]
MATELPDALSVITLGYEEAARLGITGDRLTLRRAWPRSKPGLTLEFVDSDAQVIAGQWIPDAATLQRTEAKTRAAAPELPVLTHDVGGVHIVLQGRGADRRLSELGPLVASTGARLVSHRAERRAVVRLEQGGMVLYAKVMSPELVPEIVDLDRYLRDLPQRPFNVPEVIECDAGRGVVIWSALPGRPLHSLRERDEVVRSCATVGSSLRWLHKVPAEKDIRRHDARAEIEVLRKWIERLDAHKPSLSQHVMRSADEVVGNLENGTSPSGFLHRDLHDKQVFIQSDEGVGFLDFDTAAVGEPALDVANMLVHLELREDQRLWSTGTAEDAASAFLCGYSPDRSTHGRLAAYADATRLRLACLYAFRPMWPGISAAMLDRIGQGVPGGL